MQFRMGQRLKELRNMYGFTQQQVANYLKIDQSNYSKIERGERRITKLSQLIKLADLYDCTQEYLMMTSDEYTPMNIKGYDSKMDISVIAIVNSTMNYLKMLRKIQKNMEALD